MLAYVQKCFHKHVDLLVVISFIKATWEAKNLEIENRIKTITEGITGANLIESEANAQKAVAEWNSAMAKAEVDQATKETAIRTMKQNLINMQAEGALKIVGKNLS